MNFLSATSFISNTQSLSIIIDIIRLVYLSVILIHEKIELQS
jgi:hypothetical protein